MIFLPFVFIPIIFFIIVVVIIIIVAKKSNFNIIDQKIDDFSENVFNKVKQGLFGENPPKQEKPDISCEYCGSLIPGDSKKCPNCSASVRKKK